MAHSLTQSASGIGKMGPLDSLAHIYGRRAGLWSPGSAAVPGISPASPRASRRDMWAKRKWPPVRVVTPQHTTKLYEPPRATTKLYEGGGLNSRLV